MQQRFFDDDYTGRFSVGVGALRANIGQPSSKFMKT